MRGDQFTSLASPEAAYVGSPHTEECDTSHPTLIRRSNATAKRDWSMKRVSVVVVLVVLLVVSVCVFLSMAAVAECAECCIMWYAREGVTDRPSTAMKIRKL